MRRAAIDVQFFIRASLLAEAKVDDFDAFACEVHKNVVEFKVTVSVALGVHVGHTSHQLLENVLAGFFR